MTRRAARLDIRQAGRQVFIALGVLAALNVVFYLTLAQPTVQEYRRLSEEREPFQRLTERRDVVEDHEEFLAAVRQAGTDLGALQEEILSTRNERLVEVQEELAALCEQFNIDLDSVSSGSEMLLDEELDRFSMNVPLEGNYANLREFLQAVEQSDKFLVVERVSLARGKEGGSALGLSIALATYFTAPEGVLERKRTLGRRRGR
jgi:Tfp pilus assembly protein PilO